VSTCPCPASHPVCGLLVSRQQQYGPLLPIHLGTALSRSQALVTANLLGTWRLSLGSGPWLAGRAAKCPTLMLRHLALRSFTRTFASMCAGNPLSWLQPIGLASANLLCQGFSRVRLMGHPGGQSTAFMHYHQSGNLDDDNLHRIPNIPSFFVSSIRLP
jgi:hypothetical protein